MNRSFSLLDNLASAFPEECRIAHLENNVFMYGGGPGLNWKTPEYILTKHQIHSSSIKNNYQDPFRKKYSSYLQNFSSHEDLNNPHLQSLPNSQNKSQTPSTNPKNPENPENSSRSKISSLKRTSSVPIQKPTENSRPESILSQKLSDFTEKISVENNSLGLEESLTIKKKETLGRTRTSNTSNHSQDSLGLGSVKNMHDHLSGLNKASQEEGLLNSSLKFNQSRHSSLLNFSEAKENLSRSKLSNKISDFNGLIEENKGNCEEKREGFDNKMKIADFKGNKCPRSKSVVNSPSSYQNYEKFDLESRKIPTSSKINSDHHSNRSRSTIQSANRSENVIKIHETIDSNSKKYPIFQVSSKKSLKNEDISHHSSKHRHSTEFSIKERENSLKSKKDSLKSNLESSKSYSQHSSSFSISQSSKSSSNIHSKQDASSKNPAFVQYCPSTYYKSLGLDPPHPFPNYSKRSLKRKKSDTLHFKQTFNSKLRSSENESYTYS
jgi:hypothetical protein